MPRKDINHRKYIRLNSCFPVEFSLYFSGKKAFSREYQGFTCNLSEGGICLEAKNLNPDDFELILNKKPRLSLNIYIPLRRDPVKATTEIMWVEKDKKSRAKNSYLIGLSYLDISLKDKNRILNYARRLKYIPRIAIILLLIMLIGIAALSFYHVQEREKNRALVRQLVSISEVKAGFEKRLDELKPRKEMLENKLVKSAKSTTSLEQKITGIEKKLTEEKKRLKQELETALAQQKDLERKMSGLSADKIASIELLQIELSEVIKKADIEKESIRTALDLLWRNSIALKGQIEFIQAGEVLLEEQLAQVKLKSGEITQASIGKMLKWLKVHQTKRTGLLLSYEGDRKLKDWGFTYDQALACQAFLILGERKRAENILEFFSRHAKRSKGLFYNVYDVKTGIPCEYTVHNGPNIWIAIAACQYTLKTQNDRFLQFAKEIGLEMIALQNSSTDGSIKAGPDTEWVGTEHNLDAYALFNMLYDLTKEEVYKQAALVSLDWLEGVGYNKQEGRFLRGRGDATIATDTFSWAIAAIGPAKLTANNMDPDRIMEFAEKECRVEARFYRPEGRTVDVTGFDFAKAQNIGRGGIISTEWTAQMVVAFRVMAEYYKDRGNIEKERIYKFKAEYYLSQLGKMVVSSPSPTGQGEGCLPYASMDNVETGHGWRVANGRRTGSVAGTAYYIFAHENYNPLKF
jgi:hypothetical protein